MSRKLIIAALTVGGLACANYVIDREPPHGGQGDGALDYDGHFPSDRDGGEGEGDGGVRDLDAGFGTPCNTEIRKMELSPLDLLVVLDVSYSMDYDQKWTSVKSALKSFVGNPSFKGLGVGLQFFPLRLQCRVDEYQMPAVAMGVLGGDATGNNDVAPVISASLDQQQMAGGTPTVQVLEGTTLYAKGWLARPENANHKAVIVMATDGMPDNSCLAVTTGLPNSLANVLVVASQASTTDPVVRSFVIGVGKDLGALDSIAKAGGTNKALLVDTASNADVAFLNALTQIRRSALGCEFDVPKDNAGTEGEIDPKNAQVRFTPEGSAPIYYQNVGDRTGCGLAPGTGWYFDDPNAPKVLILCDDTCNAVTGGLTGKLDVEFACKFTPT